MTYERATAAARMAESMLRVFGGCEVRLLLPVPQAGDPYPQRLGLAAGDIEEVPCSPVVVRALTSEDGREQYELLMVVSSVQPLAEVRGTQPESLLEAAQGVLFADKRLQIEAVRVEYFAGTPYLFRITAAEVQDHASSLRTR